MSIEDTEGRRSETARDDHIDESEEGQNSINSVQISYKISNLKEIKQTITDLNSRISVLFSINFVIH